MIDKHVALIIPHTDVTLEADLKHFLSDDYVIHTQRIWLDEVGEEAEKKMVDVDLPKGVDYLKGITNFSRVVFGCTSASAVYGRDGLKGLESDLQESFNCPSISAFGAVLGALDKKDKKRLGLITPYTDEVNEFMVSSLKEFGVTVTFHTGLGLIDDRGISKVSPEKIYEFVMEYEEALKTSCDALLISCTNFRAMEVRAKVEDRLGMKTITSNYSIYRWLMTL